jgi:hypothetical protein
MTATGAWKASTRLTSKAIWRPSTRHDHRADVLAAAWEAGWDDGHEQLRRQQQSA